MNGLFILFKPLNYLRIKHSQKVHWDITIPLILAFLVTMAFLLLPEEIQVFKDGGLIKEINNLLQILAGFYIASLAAVATFSKTDLDELMQGEPVKLTIKREGQKQTIHLTRRLFLCSLFGFLAYMSIFLYLFGVAANLLVDNLIGFIPAACLVYSKTTFIFVFLLVFSNIMVTTLIGLYYMSDRMHRFEPKLEE